MPLYDILNEFQKGHSHMAVVVRQSNKVGEQPASKISQESKPFSKCWHLYILPMEMIYLANSLIFGLPVIMQTQ